MKGTQLGVMSKDDLEKYCVQTLINERVVKKRYKEALTKILMHNNSISFEESYTILSELVEKETPQKTIDNCCPNCKEKAFIINEDGFYYEFNYCPECGQHLER